MTTDELLHFLGGFALALPSVLRALAIRLRELKRIYIFGWDREVAQHGPDLNERQIAEARAWGRGAAWSLRLVGTPAPAPPYPVRQVCAAPVRLSGHPTL